MPGASEARLRLARTVMHRLVSPETDQIRCSGVISGRGRRKERPCNHKLVDSGCIVCSGCEEQVPIESLAVALAAGSPDKLGDLTRGIEELFITTKAIQAALLIKRFERLAIAVPETLPLWIIEHRGLVLNLGFIPVYLFDENDPRWVLVESLEPVETRRLLTRPYNTTRLKSSLIRAFLGEFAKKLAIERSAVRIASSVFELKTIFAGSHYYEVMPTDTDCWTPTIPLRTWIKPQYDRGIFRAVTLNTRGTATIDEPKGQTALLTVIIDPDRIEVS